MHAAEKGNSSVVRFLIQSSAETNAVDRNGWTALMYAVQSGNLDVVQFLLDDGADVSIINKDGRTAIFIATTHGYSNIQRLLTQYISFTQFYDSIGQLLVPLDYSETLDEELWNLTKRRNESVQQVYRRLKELVRMFAELPVNAESIPDVQQCRFLKRSMPQAWQDRLAASGLIHDKMSELLQYFERLEMREKAVAKEKDGEQLHRPSRYARLRYARLIKSDNHDRHKMGKNKTKHGNSAAIAVRENGK
ncbi:Pfs, NACHT and Ankyrin domain containing hypothetical protein [Phytophthora palmivora]|uniref:Peptidase A2 domain-containing protein n=1 Tax=Phytophthora palmivora TaxID=4796 RepID=A0A2P4XV68_9STRA|nr:Pfs, NACHT and Ankyrin domain containing hypothetical protein [Phytophthora palmivora]